MPLPDSGSGSEVSLVSGCEQNPNLRDTLFLAESRRSPLKRNEISSNSIFRTYFNSLNLLSQFLVIGAMPRIMSKPCGICYSWRNRKTLLLLLDICILFENLLRNHLHSLEKRSSGKAKVFFFLSLFN